MKNYTVPVFVPELACPNRCVFCNQNSISGCHNQPSASEVREIIESRLKTIPRSDTHIEIGFFGGNFTGIDEQQQKEYLEIASNYYLEKRVHGIRVSTRPDYISSESLSFLKKYNVSTIEIGAQSLDEEVLKLAGRGHSVRDIEYASALIKKNGFRLGLQMMTGLPGDSPEKSILTARKIIELGADDTRIYPTLVINNTRLSELWQKGLYQPQSLEEAVDLTATLISIFNEAGVNIIRVGLHPSEDLITGNEMLSGPFHPSFRQLAETELWRRKLVRVMDNSADNNEVVIPVPADQLNEAIGFESANRKMLLKHFRKVTFTLEILKDQFSPLIIADKRIPLPAKNALRNMGELILLEESFSLYKSIAGHPDIFICPAGDQIIVSPDLAEGIILKFESYGYKVIRGSKPPGKTYPESARYNCTVTENLLIHNLKITDLTVVETLNKRKQVHVNQGYTRCNLISLSEDMFITSDRGIEKTLINEGKDILWVDPSPVLLKGQKHGFFPGCCGVLDDKLLICGSLDFHPQGMQVIDFIERAGLKVKELFKGKLTDVGSIFTFKSLVNKAGTSF